MNNSHATKENKRHQYAQTFELNDLIRTKGSDTTEGILRGVFQKKLILFAEEIPLKWILIKSLITNQTET